MKINNNIKQHGKFQIELNHNYIPTNDQHTKRQYEIDTYFFFPTSLDVTDERFSKEEIYKNLQRFFRLKASAQFLTDLYSTSDSFIADIKELLQQPILDQNKLITKFKIFVCSYESSIKKRKRRCIQQLHKEDFQSSFQEFYDQLTTFTQKFRDLRQYIKDQKLQDHFITCDEYLAYQVRGNALKLLKIFEKRDHDQKLEQYKHQLQVLIEKEYEYAEQMEYLLPRPNDLNRTYIYRIKAILKKNIWNVFYLKIHRKQDTIYMHFIYAIAAGMAMIFATVVAFLAQQKYGNFSGPLFVALVIGYMFKDRIKDFLKEFLFHLFEQKIPDKKTVLFSHNNQRIGTLQETIQFLSKSDISPRIKHARNEGRVADNIRDDNHDESVILYQKSVRLNEVQFRKIYSDIIADGIKDITRINLFPFAIIMDNPTHHALYLDKQSKELSKIKCLRTYHISVILHYKHTNHDIIERYRVVINRDGILSIEQRLHMEK